MGHRSARLTVRGRRLLIQRVLFEGMPVAHVAKVVGVSGQCAHRWVSRFDAAGDTGLKDRSSRPHSSPTCTGSDIEHRVTAARRRLSVGPDRLVDELGVPAQTISRFLRRNDEKDATTAGFLTRVAEFFASCGIPKTEAVMTDNHWSYSKSQAFTNALGTIGARRITIRPHCPWQAGKVERFNRALQTEWAHGQIFSTNSERTEALQPWLDHYNHRLNHRSLGRRPPISRVSPT